MLNKTFKDLKDCVQAFLNRNDPEVVDNIPKFIGLAEQEFARVVKIPMAEGEAIFTPSYEGHNKMPIPDDCLSPISMMVSDGEILGEGKLWPYTRVNAFAFFNIESKGTDKGRYFTKMEDGFTFYPTLKSDSVALLTYHKDLTPMSADSDTSPALKYGYDLMLYWSLKHAAVFLRDPEQESYWSGKAQDALQTMETTFNEMHWAGSPLRIIGV